MSGFRVPLNGMPLSTYDVWNWTSVIPIKRENGKVTHPITNIENILESSWIEIERIADRKSYSDYDNFTVRTP